MVCQIDFKPVQYSPRRQLNSRNVGDSSILISRAANWPSIRVRFLLPAATMI